MLSLELVPSKSQFNNIAFTYQSSVITHFNYKLLMWLATIISVLQKGSAVGRETKILRADYFSTLCSTTPGFLPHGQLLTVPQQVDVAQWWQMFWLQSWKHLTQIQLFPVVKTTQVTHSLLPLTDHRFYSTLRRWKGTKLHFQTLDFTRYSEKNYCIFITTALYKLVSPLNLGYLECILHETCICKLCLVLTSSGFKCWS